MCIRDRVSTQSTWEPFGLFDDHYAYDSHEAIRNGANNLLSAQGGLAGLVNAGITFNNLGALSASTNGNPVNPLASNLNNNTNMSQPFGLLQNGGPEVPKRRLSFRSNDGMNPFGLDSNFFNMMANNPLFNMMNTQPPLFRPNNNNNNNNDFMSKIESQDFNTGAQGQGSAQHTINNTEEHELNDNNNKIGLVKTEAFADPFSNYTLSTSQAHGGTVSPKIEDDDEDDELLNPQYKPETPEEALRATKKLKAKLQNLKKKAADTNGSKSQKASAKSSTKIKLCLRLSENDEGEASATTIKLTKIMEPAPISAKSNSSKDLTSTVKNAIKNPQKPTVKSPPVKEPVPQAMPQLMKSKSMPMPMMPMGLGHVSPSRHNIMNHHPYYMNNGGVQVKCEGESVYGSMMPVMGSEGPSTTHESQTDESSPTEKNKKAKYEIDSRCQDHITKVFNCDLKNILPESLKNQILQKSDELSQFLKHSREEGGLNLPSEIHFQRNIEKIISSTNLFSDILFSQHKRKIGPLTVEERQAKVEKYLQKRKQRSWNRRISYDCRKRVADSRLRVKGRFVTKEQAIALLSSDGSTTLDINTITNKEIKELLDQKFGNGACSAALNFKLKEVFGNDILEETGSLSDDDGLCN
eukprot:TRINITY_DN8515_c0_g2_i2.p1 TRINITY_DN8515_c0_g2~~TRINITY_DN8515_c0_g2_i2.p1  ORF type:complete len:637 (-),score=152.53 TRINITY_DN8515_c0_g2_i2:76-1986(-)